MGPVTETDSFMSAVIDRKAFDRVSGYIEHAKNSPNCSIVAGGGYDDSVGYFVEPTIVQTTTPKDRIFQEEIFGPLVTVYVYPDKVSHRSPSLVISKYVFSYRTVKAHWSLSLITLHTPSLELFTATTSKLTTNYTYKEILVSQNLFQRFC